MVIMMNKSMVSRYIKSVMIKMMNNNGTKIRCQCRKCNLGTVFDPYSGFVQQHVLMRGFMDDYIDQNGVAVPENVDGQNNEGAGEEDAGHDERGEEDAGHDNGGEEDAGYDNGGEEEQGPDTLLNSVMWDTHVQELPMKKSSNVAKEKAILVQLEIDVTTPLYAGCKPEDTRLKVTLQALQMKAKYKWTGVSFNDHMKAWHDLLPKGNICPTSIEEASKIVFPFDFPHVKYHACINDCFSYPANDVPKTKCPVCDADQYKRGKKAHRKVVWYFLLIPRVQRYFANRKEAKLMRWHAERTKKLDDDDEAEEDDKMLAHPSDATQWEALDIEYPTFGDDPRNIRLGVSTDGLNLFGNQSSTLSTWPVFVWMYNLPS
jgi:hypothetical protein